MSFSQLVAGVGTSAGPSLTTHDSKQIWMAWKGEGSDPHIYVTSSSALQPTPDLTTGQYSLAAQQQVLDITCSASPAITSLDGTLYLFWRGESDSSIYWASSTDGKTWVDRHALELGDTLVASENTFKPATSHAPTVVSGNDSLYLFWKGEGTDRRIFWSTYSHGEWLGQQAVSPTSGDRPGTDDSPGVALAGQTIHLTWKDSAGDVQWSSYTNSLWAPEQKIFSGISSAPSMVTDGNGGVWLVWLTPPSFPNILGTLAFASLGARQVWSAPAVRSGMMPGFRPALVSTGGSSQDIVMMWRNLGNDPGIYYGPLRLPPHSYVFRVDGFLCKNTRSGSVVEVFDPSSDTDYVSLSVQVAGTTTPVTRTVFAGDVQDNQARGGLALPPISVPDNAQVVMSYLITNSGGPQSQALSYGSQATEKLASAGAAAAATAAGAAIGAAIGGAIGTAVVPILGSALGALAGWLVGEVWDVAFPSCDGPVAAAVRVFTADELLAASGQPSTTDDHPSSGMAPITTQDGCGTSPVYQVTWSIVQTS